MIQSKTLISALFIFFLSANCFAQEEHSAWNKKYKEATAEATKKSKPILVSFSGSDWCANCMRLHKELFESEAFENYANENLVLLNLDFPAKKKNKLPEDHAKENQDLFDKLNKSKAFPAMVLLDAEGNMLATVKYPLETPEEYIANIKHLLGQ